MKKLCMLLCMLVAVFFLNTSAFAAADVPSVSVDNVTASEGATVDVSVKISDNTGICGATLKVQYDSRLTLTDISSGDAFSSMTFTKPGDLSANPVNLVWDSADADYTNGTIAVLSFKTPNAAGKYSVEVSYEEGGVVDGDLKPVLLNITNGNITVANQEVIQGSCGETVNWKLDNSGVLTISGKGEMKNYTYKSEMPWYKYREQIQSVVVEDGVTTIGDYAF